MNLCDMNEIKALLARHGFHFSKSMGQNFLIQDWVPRDIAAAFFLSVWQLCRCRRSSRRV